MKDDQKDAFVNFVIIRYKKAAATDGRKIDRALYSYYNAQCKFYENTNPNLYKKYFEKRK